MQDYTNPEWLAALRSAEPDTALAVLRARLARGLRYALIPKYGVTEADVEDFTQEALLRILDALDSFRGESRFTTWAQKIAVRVALSELRRQRWQDVSLHDLMPAPDHADDALTVLTASEPLPEQQAAQRQITAILQHLIAHALTARQRQAINAVMLRGMPIEEVARRMDTNRNALYKLLYDARARLKRELHARGVTAADLLAAFEPD